MRTKRMRHTISYGATALAALFALTGCGDGTGVGGFEEVAVNFRVTSATAAAPAAALNGPALVAGPPVTISGTNGDLTISEIRVIVDEIELEGTSTFCPSGDDSDDDFDDDFGDDDSDDDSDCDEFEAGPFFLDLPLDGQPIEVSTDLVPAGTYDELEFEIEDLEDDDSGRNASIRADILAEFPDWPSKASMLVVGSFTPTGEESIDFRTFVEAEVEVELDLIPSLVIEENAGSTRDVVVDISPEVWFSRPDGTVLSLHLYDFDVTGDLLELEVDMDEGFVEVEWEED